MDYLLRGVLIGLLFGLPAGAVGALTVQRTFQYGVRAGSLTGPESLAAGCLYACVGAFGLTLVFDFLLRYQTANPSARRRAHPDYGCKASTAQGGIYPGE